MKPLTGSKQLAEVLSALNVRGGFPISLLTDTEGLLLASSAAPDWDTEKQAAVVALIRNAARRTEEVEMDAADEVTVRDRQGRRLVCRPFRVGDQVMVLSVMVKDSRPYRRLTNETVVDIRRMWEA